MTDAATTLLTALGALTMVALGLQGADLVTLVVEDSARRRNARDTAPGRATRQFWSVIVPGLAALLLAVGVDLAARLMMGGDVLVGIGLIAPLALVLIAVVAVAVLVQQREPVDGFALLERRLADVPPTARPNRTEVDGWQRELVDLDGRYALRPARRPAWLSWRLAPAIVPAAFLSVAGWGAGTGVPGAPVWLSIAVLGLAGSVALGIVADRFAARARLQAARARAMSRIEIVRMLQDLERRSLRRVPGFGDRVARALAILREQQKPGSQPPRDR
ncbi:hypothetical protein ACFFGH_30605 [Lysobacter korlensis]|uniref:Transmembrane protein n=1 Tax=Lysobacter korlensis TaxID=553636 RepID=A0ABV6RZ10_9GAMM